MAATGPSRPRSASFPIPTDLDLRSDAERLAAGEHTFAVRVEDEYDNQAVAKTVLK